MLMLGPIFRDGESFSLGRQNRGAQSLQCLAQPFVADRRDPLVEFLGLGSTQRTQARRRVTARLPVLLQHQSRHGAVAEEPIDAFQKNRLTVLNFQRNSGLDAEFQRAVAARPTRKTQPFRIRAFGESFTDDRRPMLYQLCLAESLLAQRLACDSGQDRTDRLQSSAPIFCHVARA